MNHSPPWEVETCEAHHDIETAQRLIARMETMADNLPWADTG